MTEEQFKMTAMIYAPVPANSEKAEDVARFKLQVAEAMWNELQKNSPLPKTSELIKRK